MVFGCTAVYNDYRYRNDCILNDLIAHFPWNGSCLKEQLKFLVKGQYYIPEELSGGKFETTHHLINKQDAKDLFSRILNPDPRARATIPEIKRHPWYLGDESILEDSRNMLPRSQINHRALELVCKWGFDRESVVRDLMEGNDQPLRVVLYWMIETLNKEVETEDAGTPSLTLQTPPVKNRLGSLAPTRNKSTYNIEPTLSGLRSASTPGPSNSVLPPVPPKSQSSSSPSVKIGSPLLSTFRRLFQAKENERSESIEQMPRLSKDGSNSNMTSRPSSKLLADLEAIFRTMRLDSQKLKDKRPGYKVSSGSIKFFVEITQLRNVQGMSGLKFERLNGDVSEYDALIAQIMNRIRL